MTFIHGYLLAGLVLVGVPILLHLIMRQKPKQLSFPAFRFLRQKARINQRKIRLQHWLLLALRMLLIAALCFALARPRLVSSNVPFGGEQVIAAIFIFDTSPSMEYTVAGKTRLDDAKRRFHEIFDELSPSSQIAVFDTADEAGSDDPDDHWLTSSQLRSCVEGLRIRPANAPLNRQLERAYRLLQKVGDSEDAPPRFLFVFSDRTRESWDAAAAKRMQPDDGINTVYVDVGVENPKDLSIDKLEIKPAVAAPGEKITIIATVRATGDTRESEMTCQLDPEPNVERQPDKRLVKGDSEIITFERDAPDKPEGVKEAAFHVVVKLGTTDALPSNNARYATFLVRDKRKILTVVNEIPRPGSEEQPTFGAWRDAVNCAPGAFQCDVKALDDAANLTADDLHQTYQAICLFQVPQPTQALWDLLAQYVRRGGGLLIVPGGREIGKPALTDFNTKGREANVLPATLNHFVVTDEDKGVDWASFSGQHPLTAPFHEWARTANVTSYTHTNAYWEVKPVPEKATILASYADDKNRPAVVERQLGTGRVVLFTTPLDGRLLDEKSKRPLHYYWSEVFGLVLVDVTCRYLAGESSQPQLNYYCGQPITVPMPPAPFAPPFSLQGPDLAESETGIPTSDNGPTLAITQTLGSGNFNVIDGKGNTFAGFSLNIRPEEYVLDRVPVEDIEAALGKDVVLAPERTLNLREILQRRWSPPIELLPWLMMFLLLALTVESLLANFFYRRQAPSAPQPEAGEL
jgi:Aerotolerance regulator N-terminal